jgi:hypothetical protein
VSDEAGRHHEMTPHFAFHPRIVRVGAHLGAHAGTCRAGCMSPAKETTAMIEIPPLLCESGLVGRKQSVAQPHFAPPQPPR